MEKAQLIDSDQIDVIELLDELTVEKYTAYASPRRLAVTVKNVKAVQADQKIVEKRPGRGEMP